uniref:Uncharacterized protein n=1 Tax=viral metagenome TaxID=1070528 RepID=A0A6C0HSH7_9ZZZZ
MVTKNIYGIIIAKNIIFDKIYLTIFLSIPISWILCKDECIISYIIKKYNNKNYILGDNPENVDDISELFYNKKIYFIFYNLNQILQIISIIIVNNRTTNISYYIFIPTIILYIFYIYDISYKINYRKIVYPYFQILLLLYLLLCFYKILYVKLCYLL